MKEITKMSSENIQRKVYQTLLLNVMAPVIEIIDSGNVFENETFMIRPYNWEDDDEKDRNEYSFHHKPSGLKIYWYKYPLRSPKANMKVTPFEFEDVLNDCMNSYLKNTTVDTDSWWYKK